jgi:hypothetical protein
LQTAVKRWPTPTARDWKDGSAQSCKNVPVNGLLGRAVHQFPTPMSAPTTAASHNQFSGQYRAALKRAGLSSDPISMVIAESRRELAALPYGAYDDEIFEAIYRLISTLWGTDSRHGVLDQRGFEA